MHAQQVTPIEELPGAALETIAGRTDFGRIAAGAPHLTITPRTAAEIKAAVALARTRGLQVTPRGLSSSQGGQSLSDGGLALDISALDRVEAPDLRRRTIRCQAGARWRSVVSRTLQHGLLPAVLPLNLDLTVGGTLSVGGIGASSHRYGPAAANIVALEVVTGDGDLHECDATRNADLYAAVPGGMGLFGVLVSVTIPLTPAPPCVATHYLLYDDATTWLEDQRLLARSGAADYLEAYCSASIQGLQVTPRGRRPLAQWFYGLQVSVAHSPEDGDPPPPHALDPSPRAYRHVHSETTTLAEFTARYDARFMMMRRTGAWRKPHPWLESLVPATVLAKQLPRILGGLPMTLGDGHRLFLVNGSGLPAFFSTPDTPADDLACFAVLPTEVPPSLLDDTLAELTRVDRELAAIGGKRYLSGWLGRVDDQRWQEHFGNRFEHWRRTRRRFDPAGLFGSRLFPAHRGR